MNQEGCNEERWKARPRVSQAVSALALMGPIGISLGVTVILAGTLPTPIGLLPHVLWWATVLIGATLSVFGSERLFRRLLPLGALLKLTMLFPDAAPSRMKVAIRAGSTRDLERRFQAGTEGKLREPARSAADILALAAAINNHDRATRGHSERVRVLTEMIAEELGLSQSDRDRLRWSSLLHDVGKLSIHPDILNSPDKLTEEQWEEVKKHPLEGSRFTEPLQEWFGEWGLAIAQHHERYDGTGYPFGISGTSISLGARIVAVADSFEVMTASRTYKQAITPQQARIELIRCTGTQFDPDIVRAFLSISIGRLRWTIGPASWLAEAPLAQWVANATKTLGTGAHVALTSMALVSSAIVASPLLKRAAPPAVNNSSSVTPELATSSTVVNGGAPAYGAVSDVNLTNVPAGVDLATSAAPVADNPVQGVTNPPISVVASNNHSSAAPVHPTGGTGSHANTNHPGSVGQQHGSPTVKTTASRQVPTPPAKKGGSQPAASAAVSHGSAPYSTATTNSTQSSNGAGVGPSTPVGGPPASVATPPNATPGGGSTPAAQNGSTNSNGQSAGNGSTNSNGQSAGNGSKP